MRFNFKRTPTPIFNHAGSKAYTLSPEMELYSLICTTSFNDQFYEKATEKLERLRKLLPKVNPVFAAKLAIYCRTQMHLRSIPLVLAVELAKIHKGDNIIEKLVAQIIQRADEITELLAFYAIANERTGTKQLNKLSKQLQKGLQTSFNHFDEYQFAKYNKATKITLKDALCITHPKAKDEEQQILFNKIAKDELTTPYTWEVALSAVGQVKYESEAAKALAITSTWESLIDSNKLGYMALLRNLRNILNAYVSPNCIKKVCEYLSNEKAVAQSKQLPFRFLAAYRELKDNESCYTPIVLDSLEKAISYAAHNINGFDIATKVVVAADVSGSMQQPISAKSKILMYDIGLVLSMILKSKCDNVITGMFGDVWKRITVPKTNILQNVQTFYNREGEVGYSTNGHLVIQDLLAKKEIVDKVFVFTDCQFWNSATGNTAILKEWNSYKNIAPNAKLYLFDLAGYGTTPISVQRNDVYMIAGWSDKIFNILNAIENGADVLDEINKIDF